MMTHKALLPAKYKAKTWANVTYCILILAAMGLMIGRWISGLNPAFILLSAEIQMHVSNFALSLIGMLLLGYMGILYGAKVRYLALCGAGILLANVLCETLMTFLNWPDLIDALYGAAGVLVALAYVLLVKKYGLYEGEGLPDA
jgi:hypothetical protein